MSRYLSYVRNGVCLALTMLACGAASAQNIWVANGGSATIAAINVGTGGATQSPSVGGSIGGVAISPDGSTIYASMTYGNAVAAMSVANNSMLATIPVGQTPAHLAVSPNGALVYVINQGTNTVSVINTSTKTVTATIAVGSRPNTVVFSPDSSRAYVTNTWSSSITVINTATSSIAGTFATPTTPMGIAVTPDGRRLYVACQSPNVVAVLDSSAGTTVGTIGGFTFPIAVAITPDGSHAYVVNQSNATVSVVNTATNSVAGAIPVGSTPTWVAVSSDGTQAYVTNQYSYNVSVIATSNNSVIKTISSAGFYPIVVVALPANAGPTCSYTVNPTTAVSFTHTGGSASFSVTASANTCSWGVTGPNWVTLGQTTTSGSGTATVSAGANNTTQTLSGTLTVAGHQMAISEAGTTCTYSASLTSGSLAFGALGGTATIGVQAPVGCAWSVSGPVWETLTPTTTSGNGSVTVAAGVNGVTALSGTVTVAGQAFSTSEAAGASQTCTYSLAGSGSLASTAGSSSVTVTTQAGCAWSVTGNPAWVTISPSVSGTGSGTVSYSYQANTGSTARTGTITISGQNFGLTQAAPGSSGSTGLIATQSSTLAGYGPADASNAIDGNTDGNFNDHSVSHTNQEAYAWWQVDLGSSQSIGSIKVWGRTDCCWDRLTDYWVFVSNTPFLATDTPATLQSRAGTWSSHQTTFPNPSSTITVNGTGRYVRVQLSGTNYLSLAEVQFVAGTGTGGSTGTDTNVALGKMATQSSTLAGFGAAGASNAVDGNTDGNFNDHSVAHTNQESYAWWQVDLGTSPTVDSITVWGRTDCCSDRLNDYWVFVSNTPFLSTDTPATLQSRAGTWSRHLTGFPNPSTLVSTGGVVGRYVRVQLNGLNYLQLAEVQVLGH